MHKDNHCWDSSFLEEGYVFIGKNIIVVGIDFFGKKVCIYMHKHNSC